MALAHQRSDVHGGSETGTAGHRDEVNREWAELAPEQLRPRARAAGTTRRAAVKPRKLGRAS
jgi:hypothetical protein